jgi:hypothetical protein
MDYKIMMGVLVEWAKDKTSKSYTDLTNELEVKTGKYYIPVSLGKFLGELNQKIYKIDKNAPAISILVISKEYGTPSDGIWGCSPNVPEMPDNEVEIHNVLFTMKADVLAYDWNKVLKKL